MPMLLDWKSPWGDPWCKKCGNYPCKCTSYYPPMAPSVVHNHFGLTEEQVRKIIREEIKKLLDEMNGRSAPS